MHDKVKLGSAKRRRRNTERDTHIRVGCPFTHSRLSGRTVTGQVGRSVLYSQQYQYTGYTRSRTYAAVFISTTQGRTLLGGRFMFANTLCTSIPEITRRILRPGPTTGSVTAYS